jgi:hypothetical protein
LVHRVADEEEKAIISIQEAQLWRRRFRVGP